MTDFKGSHKWELYIASICGLIIALDLEWIYFDIEANKQTSHALRRKWVTGVLWSNSHLPLSASIIIGAAGLRNIIAHFADGMCSVCFRQIN